MAWEKELDELARRTELSQRMGGPEKLKRHRDAGKLPAVEKLAVRKMNVGEGDVAHLDDLGPSARQAARQSRRR